MKHICKITGKEFEILDKEVNVCKKMVVPLPAICPEERIRLLMSHRNEWKLYKRKCDATGEDIISAYHKDAPFPVYKNKFWWGSEWSALDYGRDFDFNRPFFEQYADLQKVVPREGTSVFNSENCDYNSHIRESRNCYLNSLVYCCEDIDYCYWMGNSKNSTDCYFLIDSELCYWCIDVFKSYNCAVLQEGSNCSECYFSFQLRGCNHCFFCSNLADKSYYIFNKKCTKEEFEKTKKQIFNGSYDSFWQAFEKFLELKVSTVHRFVHNLNCENVIGDHVTNCRNSFNVFEGYDSEDIYHSISFADSRDVYSCYSAGWAGCDRIFSSAVTRGSTDIAFCVYTFYSSNLRYCHSSNRLDNCFGCIGLQHKQYCILNKQYTQQQYEKLVPKIIEHMKKTQEWGQIFPPELSVFAYNESAAQDYYPLAKEQALSGGFKWREEEKKDYQPATVAKVPGNINDVNNDFIKEILICEDCKRNYRIIERELKFYKTYGLPLPHKCSNCRHKTRSEMRNPMKLFARKCDSCSAGIQSSYPPNEKAGEKCFAQLSIDCEKCYLKEII